MAGGGLAGGPACNRDRDAHAGRVLRRRLGLAGETAGELLGAAGEGERPGGVAHAEQRHGVRRRGVRAELREGGAALVGEV